MDQNSKVTIPYIHSQKSQGAGSHTNKLTALTAYDFTMARLLDRAGVDIILVGDSVASVVQGLSTTLPVTLDEMVYHSSLVSRAVKRALLVADLPFMSYQGSVRKAIESAGRLIKEGGAHAVKLEGGLPFITTVERLVELDIPVMGHVGLTPQSVHRMGGYKVQGKDDGASDSLEAGSANRILADAQALAAAGAFAIVLEGIPDKLAAEITAAVNVPTIGIGAGGGCDGQILVINDLLGLGEEKPPKFVKQYAKLSEIILEAVGSYLSEVRSGKFPAVENSYQAKKSTPPLKLV